MTKGLPKELANHIMNSEKTGFFSEVGSLIIYQQKIDWKLFISVKEGTRGNSLD